MSQRKKALERFNDANEMTIFLLSMRAGSVGLTLTAACHVYLMEPSINPALTAQAINRVHRIGQTKQVFVYHLVVKDSIEEKVLEINKEKLELMDQKLKNDPDFIDQISTVQNQPKSSLPLPGSLSKDQLSLRQTELAKLLEETPTTEYDDDLIG